MCAVVSVELFVSVGEHWRCQLAANPIMRHKEEVTKSSDVNVRVIKASCSGFAFLYLAQRQRCLCVQNGSHWLETKCMQFKTTLALI